MNESYKLTTVLDHQLFKKNTSEKNIYSSSRISDRAPMITQVNCMCLRKSSLQLSTSSYSSSTVSLAFDNLQGHPIRQMDSQTIYE